MSQRSTVCLKYVQPLRNLKLLCNCLSYEFFPSRSTGAAHQPIWRHCVFLRFGQKKLAPWKTEIKGILKLRFFFFIYIYFEKKMPVLFHLQLYVLASKSSCQCFWSSLFFTTADVWRKRWWSRVPKSNENLQKYTGEVVRSRGFEFFPPQTSA